MAMHALHTYRDSVVEIHDDSGLVARIAWDDRSDPQNSIGWILECIDDGRQWWEPIGGNCVGDDGAISEDATDGELIAMVTAELGK